MSGSNINPYLRTKIMTASPEELRLMLYDGAIKFCRQAVDAIAKQQWEPMYNALTRAQKIVLELSSSLNHEVAPEMTGKLSALYNYVYRRLVDANLERDTTPVHECIELLEYERETWVMVMKKLEQGESLGDDAKRKPGDLPNPLGKIGPSGAGRYPNADHARDTAISSLSIQG